MIDVVTLGETMILLNPEEEGSLKYVTRFIKQLGGAESNFAIALSRLGIKVGWISRLGKDGFGDYIESFIRGEGVDVSHLIRDPDHPTGLMIKERHIIGESKMFYYRKGSAASYMSPQDLDEEYIAQAKYLHITGITPALSASCRETLYKAIEIAKKHGLTITFDPNLRLRLWGKEEMKRVILDIASKADIILPGFEEGKLLLDTEETDEIIKRFLSLGINIVILKMGERGAILGTKEEIIHIPGYKVEKIVDPIGAGDGFAAGFVAGQLKGYSLRESVSLANALGAFALTVKGDVEGYPTWEELEIFLGKKEDIKR